MFFARVVCQPLLNDDHIHVAKQSEQQYYLGDKLVEKVNIILVVQSV